jgi:predicted enzyme related to lactoylglutathione lyase
MFFAADVPGGEGLVRRGPRCRAVLRPARFAAQLAYGEFRVGDYQHELGIVDRRFAASPGHQPEDALVYWHVGDIRASFEWLLSFGVQVHEGPVERGPGFVTASVVDPFGNVLGVMYNRHYLEVLEAIWSG